jgi:hypothetical protein
MRHLRELASTRQQSALKRRSDQVSRGVIRRRTVEAIGNPIVESRERTVYWQRRSDSDCHRRLRLCNAHRAHRTKRTILAIVALLCLRTARHVGGHCRHIAHLGSRQPLRRRWRDQRRSNKPGNRKDREQTTNEPTKIHSPISHRIMDLGRPIASQTRHRRKTIRSQLPAAWLKDQSQRAISPPMNRMYVRRLEASKRTTL